MLLSEPHCTIRITTGRLLTLRVTASALIRILHGITPVSPHLGKSDWKKFELLEG